MFDIDIEEGKPPLKLPYNLTESPWDAARKFLEKNGIACKTEWKAGEPASTIVAAARRAKADMIVMGAYVHSRLREMVLGGTTQSLLRNTPVPLFLSY